MFRLNYLYDDGARICLMSEHAPAFFALQMSETKLNTPLIVMDGAAIFDANENRYLSLETLPAEDSERLKEGPGTDEALALPRLSGRRGL